MSTFDLVARAGPAGFVSVSHAATWTARQGVGSHAVPVAFVAECSRPLT